MKRASVLVFGILFVLHFHVAAGDYPHAFSGQVTVMTQNLYIGANLNKLIMFQQTGDPSQIPRAVAELFDSILETNFEERAESIAEEIEHERPDLIGLQEAFRITVEPLVEPADPFDPLYPPPPNEEHDYLSDLLFALSARGLQYKVAVTITNVNIPLPRLTQTGGLDVVRFVDRDVILVRKNIAITEARARNFRTNLELEGVTLADQDSVVETVWRGFTAVNARVRGITYRFVNTHLEVRGEEFGAPELAFIQAAQAKELLTQLREEALPIIVVGDLNASPLDESRVATTPYIQFVNAGYRDVWTLANPDDPGFTCCQEEALKNKKSILNERIDFVFLRNIEGAIIAKTVGDDSRNKTPSGLWPSDHAGVVAKIISH